MTKLQAFMNRGWVVKMFPASNGLWVASAAHEGFQTCCALAKETPAECEEALCAYMAEAEQEVAHA